MKLSLLLPTKNGIGGRLLVKINDAKFDKRIDKRIDRRFDKTINIQTKEAGGFNLD